MTEQLPEPLVPAEVDLGGFPSFMLNVEKLLASELVALASLEELGAAMLLWSRAWQQRPHGSLPDDDRVLAAYAKAGPRWKKIKAMAMRGFILCADGRLYHRTLCQEVMEAWRRRAEHRETHGDDHERQRRWRARQKEMSARLRERGITPPKGASLETLNRLLETSTNPRKVDADVDGTVDANVDGEMPRRDRTGQEEGVADADARASPPVSPGELPEVRKAGVSGLTVDELIARKACMAKIVEHFPGLDRHATAYPSLTGSLGIIDTWAREGAQLDRDVLPVIDGMCLKLKANGEVPFSFHLFTPKIAAAKSRNSKGLPPARSGTDDPAIPAFLHRAAPIRGERATAAIAAAFGGFAPADADRPRDGPSQPGSVVDAAQPAAEVGAGDVAGQPADPPAAGERGHDPDAPDGPGAGDVAPVERGHDGAAAARRHGPPRQRVRAAAG